MSFKLYREEMVFSLLMTVLLRLSSFFSTSYMLKYVLNGVETGKKLTSIIIYLVVVITVAMILNLTSELCRLFLYPKFRRRGNYRLNRLIYEKSVNTDLSDYEDPQIFELFNDATSLGTEVIRTEIPYSINMFVSHTLNILLTAGLAYSVHPVLLLFIIIPVCFNLLSIPLNKVCFEYDKSDNSISRQISYAERTFYFKEYAKEMRMTNIYKVMLQRFEVGMEQYKKLLKTKGIWIATVSCIMNIGIEIISMFAAESYCIYHAFGEGDIYSGDCIVMFNLFANLFSNIQGFENLLLYSGDISLRAGILFDYLNRVPKISNNDNGKEALNGAIELKNLSFRYREDSADVIKHLNLKINKGEKILIVGRNGAGKSTLVKLLMHLYEPTEGEILLNGVNISDYRLKSYRSLFGTIFQNHSFFAISIAENVLGRPYNDGDEYTVKSSLEKVGLLEKVESFSNGIHTHISNEYEKDGVTLSGGEMQKLALAAIYAKNSPIIVLDEPTSSLDPVAEEELYSQFYTLGNNKTTIYISHRLSFGIDADRIIYLDNGRIIEEGTHKELIELNGKYAAMFNAQADNYTQEYIEK